MYTTCLAISLLHGGMPCYRKELCNLALTRVAIVKMSPNILIWGKDHKELVILIHKY